MKGNTKRPLLSTGAIGAIYVIDEMMLPVIHVGPLPLKVSYVFAFAWLLLSLVRVYVTTIEINGNIDYVEGKKIVSNLWLMIIISLMSELTLSVLTEVVSRSAFVEGIEFLLFYLACFGLGYNCCKLNKSVFVYVLYSYCLLNFILVFFSSYIPSSIYNFYIDVNVLADRARGTGGNPNTTLLQMNMILLSIIILFAKGQLELEGIHKWLVLVIPVMTNLFVSSRGEFIQTVVLESVYLFYFLKRQRDFLKTIVIVGLLFMIIGAGYLYVTKSLYQKSEFVRVAIDRITALSNLTEVGNASVKQTSTYLRPFIHFEEFRSRFKNSPIWGCGYSEGLQYDFQRAASRYHNDLFKILASTGIVGLMLWIANIKRFVQCAGWIVLVPFFTSAISNTFIQSTHAINLYFFTFGVLMHLSYCELVGGDV